MKLYFLHPSESALADRDPTILQGVRSELLGRPGILEAPTLGDAEAIVLHEQYSFKEWRYIGALLADPVVGKAPHKIYTINLDDAATGLLRGVYTSLPRRRIDSSLHRVVPYASSPNEFVVAGARDSHPAPRYLATWRGNPKSNRKLRSRLLALYGRSPRILVESTDSWLDHRPDEKQHYVELMLSGHFSLCPAGWAPGTYRVYESMALGIAPVLIADEYVPPEGPDWREISVRVAEKDLPAVERQLQDRVEEAAEMGRRAQEAWRRHFSAERIMAYYSDALLSCMRARSADDSAQTEIARWRSLKMYWSNRWTVPQRIRIKLDRLMA